MEPQEHRFLAMMANDILSIPDNVWFSYGPALVSLLDKGYLTRSIVDGHTGPLFHYYLSPKAHQYLSGETND